ncbi:hypothetical protein SLEP1_g52941 [Rubroshorea leprosula]|nr:hypothetical protein SLEP1_g52941 [Rubroshorea leprosula]
MQTSIGSNSTTADDGVKCIESERQSLLAFKQVLVDENGWLSSWGSEEEKKNCCEWEGVQCSNTTGHITMLNLSKYSYDHHFVLRGNLSPSLFELHHLIYLDLSGNNFNLSHIPESIGSLNKIQHLDLYHCNLSGSLPSQLANLTSLQYLDLSYNNFNSVKNLEWLSRLSYLQYLDLSQIDLSKVNNDWLQYFPIINSSSTSLVHLGLSGNNLTASAFQWLFNLSNSLVSLYLSSNQFRGPIPETFSHMTLLEELLLSNNQFEGEIPKSFWSGNLSSLRYLVLSSNKLSGNIPKSIGLLSKLEVLYISFNSFNGVITEEHFSTLSNLLSLGMSSNNLSINFSRDWIPPFQLKGIQLASCKLGPDFPSWLQTQKNYVKTGPSSSSITAPPSLYTLPNSFSDLAMTDSKSPSAETKHHSPTKAEAKAVSSLYTTGRTMVFAYGVTFAFVACTAFLVPNPSSNSSPWIKNFLKSSSSSSRFSSLFFSFVSNSSQTDGNPLPFTRPPAAPFRVSWESSGFSGKNGSLSSDGESGVSEDVRVFNQTGTLLFTPTVSFSQLQACSFR